MNPAPAWIVADWASADAATRARLVDYAARAGAWSGACRADFAARDSEAVVLRVHADDAIASVPAGASPYDAFDAFRAIEVDFRRARDASERAHSLGSWEASFFFQPVEAHIHEALREWERRASPRLAGSAGTVPLGLSMPVATTASSGSREARYCGYARDHGTAGTERFQVPAELRGLVRAPYDATSNTPVAPVVRPSDLGASTIDGVVRSVTATADGWHVALERSWTTMEQRPPCHVETCRGIDCGMVPGGARRTVCRDVAVAHRARFDALFATLPRGLTLGPGDLLSFFVEEPFDGASTPPAHVHAVVLEWAERGSSRLYSLGP